MGLSEDEATPDSPVELGLDQVAQHVSPGPHHERQVQGHDARRHAVRPASEAGAAAIEGDLAANHHRRYHAPALPRLVEFLHLPKNLKTSQSPGCIGSREAGEGTGIQLCEKEAFVLYSFSFQKRLTWVT